MWTRIDTGTRYATLPRAVEALNPVEFTRYGAFDEGPHRPIGAEGKHMVHMLLECGTAITLCLDSAPIPDYDPSVKEKHNW